ncbi:MAG: Ig-like domain-containing protein, partial [Deltaproteobacteria bacterium]|nr:Ig-like domain-containing protein [Deltaproteobacteria bacterium]
NIDLKSLEGEKLCGVSVTGPPARGQFYPQVVQLIYDPVPPEVVSNNKPNGSTGIMPGDDTITITLNEAADPSTVNNTTVIVKDSKGNIVEGTVYLAADGKTIVFIPKYGYKYGETYTMYINGVKDLGGNRLAPYSSSFSTFKPEIIATVPAPGAIDIDTYKNFVAVDSWHYEGVCSTPHSRITIIDVTDPAQPQKRGETLLYQTVYDIKALPEEDKIVATGFRQYCSPKSKRGLIEVVDVSDPAAPREALPFTGGVYLSWAAGSEEPPPNVPYQFGEPVEAALIGTNAFVANSGLGIQAIDLSRLTPPEEAAQASAIGGTFSTTANTDPNATMLDLFPSVSKAGTKILALKYNRLIILSPQLTALGELSGLNHAYSVTGVGSFPIDIDNDGNIGTFEDNDGDPTTSQQETFDLAFISTQDGIVIADVTTASSPRIIDMIPGEAGNVVVDRTRRIAYNGGLSIFSLKSLRPEPPANLGAKIDTDGDGVDDRVLLRMPEASGRNVLSEDGNLLYAADYSNGLVKVIRIGISHYDLSPTSDTQVSADEPEVPIILYAKDSSQGAPLTIRWNLEGAGGTLSEAETTSSNGIFTTTLTTSRTAGANYKITPKLVKENGILEDLGVTTGNITVVPGLATQIALTPTSTN